MKMDIWEGIAPKWCHPTRLYDQKSLRLHTIPSSELRSGYIWFFSSLSRAKVQIPRLLLTGHPTVTLEKWLVSLGLKVVIPISSKINQSECSIVTLVRPQIKKTFSAFSFAPIRVITPGTPGQFSDSESVQVC